MFVFDVALFSTYLFPNSLSEFQEKYSLINVHNIGWGTLNRHFLIWQEIRGLFGAHHHRVLNITQSSWFFFTFRV